MSMSRKDYEAIAKVFQTIRWVTQRSDEITPLQAVDACVTDVANVFAADNPRFDRERFYRVVEDKVTAP